jgi:hypothetical protein
LLAKRRNYGYTSGEATQCIAQLDAINSIGWFLFWVLVSHFFVLAEYGLTGRNHDFKCALLQDILSLYAVSGAWV